MKITALRPNLLVILLLVPFISMFISCTKSNKMELQSPNGNVEVKTWLNELGQLNYQVFYNKKPVIKPSILGIERSDADFAKGLKWKSNLPVARIEDKYALTVHKQKDYQYVAIQSGVVVESVSGEEMQVIFNASDNGVAFRYYFPKSDTLLKKITKELSSFAFDSTSRAWLQPCAHSKAGWGQTNPSYEEHYLKNIAVGTPSPLAGWVFPALFKAGETWVLISETAVDRNYCASRMAVESPNGVYSICFPEEKEVVFSGELNPQSSTPWYTPWRIMAIGSLADIVESTLGTDIAKPAVAGDFSWVKPGRASWSWVLLKDSKTIYPVQKQFIDYAADMGWEYTLIDAFWDAQIGYDKIAELANYAKTKNVKLILWYNSAGDWNTAPLTPRNALLTHDARMAEFNRIKNMGISGVKIDFFGGDGQSVMNYYIDILEDAAKVGLVVNFHGSTIPRGWQRTYPNLVSMEAIKGMEFTTFSQEDMNPVANHCATIPFTRNVFDPMDFTPTCFGEVDNIQRVTTNTFELALPILFQSGVQHFAEIPEVMAKQPDYVQQIMKDIPVIWDEIRFVDGFPGEYVVIARKSGDKWYVGGINGLDTEKTVNVDLSFTGECQAQLVTDGETNRQFNSVKMTLKPGQPLNLTLKPHGGFVVVTQ